MLKKQYLKSKPICKVTFSLPLEAAQDAKEVKVLGDFNNWNWEEGALMKAGKDAYSTTVELETGRNYQFRYLIDRENWQNDYQADQYVPSEFGGIDNSVVFVEEAKTTAAKPKAKVVKKKAAPVKKAVAKKKAAPVKKVAKAKKAAVVAKDDLKKIEGIGPKIAGLLNEAGITTFSGLAKAKASVLKEVLSNAGSRYKMHDPTTWMEQAKLAANDKWEALEKLQKELKGGKRK
jgi:predicted flap endonuclease-1-like 5' DNA nuclease